jgi:hypothetical protein
MTDFWRVLRVGDTVRVVAWPQELYEDRLHNETRELYKWLIDTRTVLRIVEIDAWGLPYGEVFRVVGHTKQAEYLALNHGGLEIVPQSQDS